ncbi:hypothetical protein KC336_g14205, partial [Hortaea werneckii]
RDPYQNPTCEIPDILMRNSHPGRSHYSVSSSPHPSPHPHHLKNASVATTANSINH